MLQGVAEQSGAVSADVSNACLICPDRVRSGETSPADAARMEELVTCPDSEVDAERCLAVAEAAASGVGRGCYQGAVGSGEPSDGTTGVAKPVRGRPSACASSATRRQGWTMCARPSTRSAERYSRLRDERGHDVPLDVLNREA